MNYPLFTTLIITLTAMLAVRCISLYYITTGKPFNGKPRKICNVLLTIAYLGLIVFIVLFFI